MRNGQSSPTNSSRQASPTSGRRRSSASTNIPGFRAPPRKKQTPIEQMTIDELRDQHERNLKLLSAPAPSTSTYVQRISAEQARIEARLVELVGIDDIRAGLARANLNADTDMPVEAEPTSHAIGAKQRALARNAPHLSKANFSMEEAMELERQAHMQELRRQEELLQKKRRRGIPIPGEVLSRKEQEARIWAFMNHKPSDSDMEEDDDEDDDEDDPSTWYDDDQDDGIKGQPIVEPDVELAGIIRIDTTRIPRNEVSCD